jgi:DNA mismatch endonuclease (patch repair protein)
MASLAGDGFLHVQMVMRIGDFVPEAWTPTIKGQHLRGRRTRNTRPELALRSAVHGLGLRFRIHQTVTPRCTPDFVLPRYRLAVFVDGCFWHGCPAHSPARFHGPNAERWERKLATNRERDRRNNQAAEKAGWQVVRLWECEVRTDAAAAADRVLAAAHRRSADG